MSVPSVETRNPEVGSSDSVAARCMGAPNYTQYAKAQKGREVVYFVQFVGNCRR